MSNLFEWVLRFAARHANSLPLRSAFRAQLVLVGQDERVRERQSPAGGSVLVLAPHMDDEVFGCGGTLRLAARRGVAVTVVYMTDGRKGYDVRGTKPDSESDRTNLEEHVVETRKGEARAVSELLGFQPPVFLDLPDGALTVSQDAVSGLAKVLSRHRPAAIFLPFLTDPHRDHWATSCLLLEAATRSGLSGDTECWGYEIWAPLQANRIVDITAVMKEKEVAMQRYRSQTGMSDFPRVFQGLSMYRSLFTQRGQGYAEAFWVTELSSYRSLHEAIIQLGAS